VLQNAQHAHITEERDTNDLAKKKKKAKSAAMGVSLLHSTGAC